MAQLTLHMPHAHMPDVRNVSKPDKHPRPTAKLDMNEHEFRFFQGEWEDYKNSTGIRGTDLLSELWIMLTPDLKKLAFDQGSKALLDTKAKMMARIKSLAVSVVHAAIHTVRLHEAKQLPEKSAKAFAARDRGIAANCELQELCHQCFVPVCYTEATLYHIVMAGLNDRDLQQHCTAQALLGNVTNINQLVEF